FAFVPSEYQRLLTLFPGNGAIQAITTQSVFALPGTRPRTDVANPFATVVLGGQNFTVAQPEFSVAIPFNETPYSARFDLKVTKKDNVTFRYEFQRQNFINSLAQTNALSGFIPAKRLAVVRLSTPTI